jgi:hypothetical protein
MKSRSKRDGATKSPSHARRAGYRTKPKAVVNREPEFKGRCNALKGFIFDCSDERHTDMYSATMKEISEYVGREYSNGGDIRYTVENEKMFVVQVPADPVDKVSASEKRIWEQIIDEYVKRENRLVANCETL